MKFFSLVIVVKLIYTYLVSLKVKCDTIIKCKFILPIHLVRQCLIKFKHSINRLNENAQLRHSMLQKYRIKVKINARRIIKTTLMIVSLCGLIYQVQMIYDQYMSGKTVVNQQ